jgi:hypothetical protein
MKFTNLLLAIALTGGLLGVGYAGNNTANVINAAANFLNALNGQQVSGSYAQQPAITASDMAGVCRGQDVRYYDDCMGVVVYPNGNIYSGEFRKGLRDGWGMIRVLAPGVPSDNYIGSSVASTYVGQFADNRINGVGTWTTDTGITFVGEYVNNRLVKVLN